MRLTMIADVDADFATLEAVLARVDCVARRRARRAGMHRVPYDVERTLRAARASGRPDEPGERLREGR